MPIDGDPFDGPADAKVTLVKAYDYACPYCERVRGTMDDLRKKYGNDLRVVYKQFVVHPQVATAGALAFCAAAKQGKAHEMDTALWDKAFKQRQFDKDAEGGQKCWESAAGCPIVLGFAKELGLDVDKFKADMKECQQLSRRTCASCRRSASARRRRSSSTAGSCRARCRSTTSCDHRRGAEEGERDHPEGGRRRRSTTRR